MEIKTEPTWEEVWQMICDVNDIDRIQLIQYLHTRMDSRGFLSDHFKKLSGP